MFWILSLAISVLSTAVFAVPLGWFLLRKKTDAPTKCALAVFALYLIAMFSLVGVPAVDYIRFDPIFNFIPLADMISSPKTAVLNVLLFVPLGVMLPVLWRRRCGSLLKVAAAGFALSLGIEVLQILTFRLTDVNDLITNTLGSAVGYLAYSLCLRNTRAVQRIGCDGVLSPASVIFVLFLAMFLVGSPVSGLIWDIIL